MYGLLLQYRPAFAIMGERRGKRGDSDEKNTCLAAGAASDGAAERFEVTDGVYVALPDVFVAYTRDSVQDKQSDFLGVDVSLLTELMDEVGYCCALLHGTHFSQCFFSVTASIFQDFADMPQERLDAEHPRISSAARIE